MIQYNIDHILRRRDPATNGNCAILQAPASDWEWKQHVHIFEDLDDNTKDNREKWARNIVAELNRLGKLPEEKGGFKFTSTFEYIDDVSHDPPIHATGFLFHGRSRD